jgi:hypothetical protein
MAQSATALIPQLERREAGTRYRFSFPVKATWQSQAHEVTSLGITENIGPAGVLVHFKELPQVGSRISIEVREAVDTAVTVEAEVIRVIHNPDQPLAALAVTTNVNEWQRLVWATARQRITAAMGKPPEEDDGFFN